MAVSDAEKELLFQKHRNFHLVYVSAIAASPTGLLGILLKYPEIDAMISQTRMIPVSWIITIFGYASIVGTLHLKCKELEYKIINLGDSTGSEDDCKECSILP